MGSLSEQQLVDCSGRAYLENGGCQQGLEFRSRRRLKDIKDTIKDVAENRREKAIKARIKDALTVISGLSGQELGSMALGAQPEPRLSEASSSEVEQNLDATPEEQGDAEKYSDGRGDLYSNTVLTG